MKERLVIGTRGSRLALAQTNWVQQQLQTFFPLLAIEQKVIITRGDRDLDNPLPAIGGKGLFTLELEQQLLEGSIDLAVHSLKDLPTSQPSGLCLGAFSPREDARDVLISSHSWEKLPYGATVGTSSPRRKYQLLAMRPDLRVESIRGNIETRIQKGKDSKVDALVLALAGIKRLKLEHHIQKIFSSEEILPAPGQGVLGIQCRETDSTVLHMLEKIQDKTSSSIVEMERSLLKKLEVGCSFPIAILGTQLSEDFSFLLKARIGFSQEPYFREFVSKSNEAIDCVSRLEEEILPFLKQLRNF